MQIPNQTLVTFKRLIKYIFILKYLRMSQAAVWQVNFFVFNWETLCFVPSQAGFTKDIWLVFKTHWCWLKHGFLLVGLGQCYTEHLTHKPKVMLLVCMGFQLTREVAGISCTIRKQPWILALREYCGENCPHASITGGWHHLSVCVTGKR